MSGLGPKTFEQCAGFLKIPESGEPLDNTWVHPENYEAARELFAVIKSGGEVSAELKKKLEEKYGIGETTISDILLKTVYFPQFGCPARATIFLPILFILPIIKLLHLHEMSFLIAQVD